jgi:L,D-transpeptidase catalytic domain/Putative peptidoglycan binding domain
LCARMTGDEATAVARKTFSTIAICLSVAAAVAIAAAPADARKRGTSDPAEEAIADANNGQPMTLIVSLSQQRVDVYRGMTLITSSQVSTGMPGHATKAGVFSILEKQRYHHSNMYSGAPMPWMNRITWSGTALHAGVVPNHPASHGCIRLPYSFAPKLYKITTVGEHVVVSHNRITPALIEHPALFQPLPPPAPPILVKQQEQPKQPPKERQSSNEAAPASSLRLPVILAKAEMGVGATDAPAVIDLTASTDDQGPTAADPSSPTHAQMAPKPSETDNHAAVGASAAVQPSVSASSNEDTHIHAIDPTATAAASAAHAEAVTRSSTSQVHAALDTSAQLVKHQDRLGGDERSAPSAELPNSGESDAAKGRSAPILTVSAAAMAAPSAPSPVAAVVPMTAPAPAQTAEAPQAATAPAAQETDAAPAQMAEASPDDPAHPPLPAAKPSVIAAKLVAGAAAAGVEAAEPRSTAPLRILITRRTQRDRMIDVQYMLSSMGYLEPQDFDGTFGNQTANAIKAFQKANNLPETGAFTEDLVKKVYEVAAKGTPPDGHLFVRQQFSKVFDTPVSFRDPGKPLGTHLFTVMNFAPGDTKAQWMSFNLQGDDSAAVLDRLEIPDDVRQKISERLTPGSSLIVADTAINSATLPRGADFLVWDTGTARVQKASITADDDVAPQPKKRRYRSITRGTNDGIYARRYRRNYPGWPF